MVFVEEDDLAGLEDVSSDEDDSYEAELTDGDSNSTGTTTSRRPYKKKARSMYSHLSEERQHDVMDDHLGKSRSRCLSPTHPSKRSFSWSPVRASSFRASSRSNRRRSYSRSASP
ncbi:CHD3-type chromatin-remodeling factor PICKLE-like, partial [Trifolium medium]|nr:CHD3-type chromatin-remodeling factor PICKLE-like [Trifolium medium]